MKLERSAFRLLLSRLATFLKLELRTWSLRRKTSRRPAISFLCFDLSVLDIYDSIISACLRNSIHPIIVGFKRVDVLPDKNKNGFVSEAKKRYPAAKVVWADGADRRLRKILRNSHTIFFTGGSGAYPVFLKIENLSDQCDTAYIQYGFLLGQHEDYQFGASHVLSARHIFAHTFSELQQYLRYSAGESTRPGVYLAGYPRWESMFHHERHLTKSLSAGKPRVALAFHWTIGDRGHNRFGSLEDRIDELTTAVDAFPSTRFAWVPHPNLMNEITLLPKFRRSALESKLQIFLSKPNVDNWSGVATSEVERESVAIISDCVSFLADFFPGGKPYLFVAREGRARLTALGEKIISSYQIRWPHREIVHFLRDVLCKPNTSSLGDRELDLLAELEFFRSTRAGDTVLEALDIRTS